MRIPDILSKASKIVAKNSPAILTALGIAGFGTTVVLAVRATPAADAAHRGHIWKRHDIEENPDIQDVKEALRDDIIEEVKEIVPLYAPALGMGIVSIVCFVGASKIHADRHAAIMAAYSLSEKTLATYQEKVRERLGADVHSDIHDEVMKELVDDDTAPDGTLVVKEGKWRFYDTKLGRYFYSTREEIMAAESEINRRLLAETRVNLSEFYYAMGIDDPGQVADCMGWDISDRYAQAMEIWFTPMFDDEKNPCTAIHYRMTIFERSV